MGIRRKKKETIYTFEKKKCGIQERHMWRDGGKKKDSQME